MTTDTAADAAANLGARVFSAMTDTYDVLSIYLGDRLGLYEAVERLGPANAATIGAAAGVDARYTREWLEHQAASGILHTADHAAPADERRYAMPAGHTEVLTDKDSLSNLIGLVRIVIGTIVKTPELLRVFRTGEGIDWSTHGEDVVRGQEIYTRPMFLHQLGQEWLPALPEVHARLQQGGRVADIGCGGGWASIGIAKAFPNVTVDGFDLDAASIGWARENAANAGVADRVTFHAGDAATVKGATGYDLVLGVEMIHDLAQPVEVLRTMREMAQPSGTVLVADENVAETFEAPGSEADRFMYGFSIAACLPNSRFTTPSAATGTVIRPATMREYALAAGFRDIETPTIPSEAYRFYRLIG